MFLLDFHFVISEEAKINWLTETTKKRIEKNAETQAIQENLISSNLEKYPKNYQSKLEHWHNNIKRL